MFNEKNKKVREEIADWLYTIWDIFFANADGPIDMEPLFFNILFDDYSVKAVEKPQVSEEYHLLLTQIEPKLQPSELDDIHADSYVSRMIQHTIDSLDRDPNSVNGESLESLALLIDALPNKSLPKLNELHTSLLLAIYGTNDSSRSPKLSQYTIRSDKDREKAYMLLLSVTKKLNKQQWLIKFIGEIHSKVPWRSYHISDWNIWYIQFQPNSLGYTGLENMNNTCYVNSLLQQLFFLNKFKEAVVSVDDAKGILSELQQVFGVLNEKSCKYFCPKSFCAEMNVVPGVQEDVKEFMNRLFTNLKNDIKDTKNENLLDNRFEISLSNKIICKECGNINESITSNYILPLSIENYNNIVESLQNYTKAEILKGETAYDCPKCRRKTEATKEVAIASFPHYMFLELGRFVRKPDCEPIKLTKFCEFPYDIDMGHFSSEKTDAVYSLKGVILHKGSATNGHYYSFVRDKKKKNAPEDWFQIDDKKISKFDIEKVPETSFGIKQPGSKGDSIGSSGIAYIIVYEKNSVVTIQDDSSLPIALQQKLEEIHETNLLKRYVFNPDYEFFILSLIQMKDPNDKNEAFIAILTYFLTTAIHSKSISEELYQVFNILKKWCTEGNVKLAKEVITTFTRTEFLKEFLTICPKEEPRRITYSFLKMALKRFYVEEQSMIANPSVENPSLTISLLHSVLHEMNYLLKPLCGQYFQLLCFLTDLHEPLKGFLSDNLLVGVALELLEGVDTTKCQKRLIKKFEAFTWTKKSLIDPMSDKLPPMHSYDKIVQPKFPLELIKKLLPLSFNIQENDLKDTLKAFQTAPGLTNLYTISKVSKVAICILSQILKMACEKAPVTYFTPIVQYVCNKLTVGNYKDLSIYYVTLLRLFDLHNKADEVISMTVKTLNTGFETQPFTIVISYIDFIIEICARNERYYGMFSENSPMTALKSFLAKLIKWISNNSPPTGETPLFRNGNKVWSQVSEELNDFCIERNQQRLSELKQINSEDFGRKDFDSSKDMDIYSEKVKVTIGSTYDIFLDKKGKWVVGTVENIEDEYLKFSYVEDNETEKSEKWLEMDSEKIFSLMQKTNNIKRREEELLMAHDDSLN